ncbi:MAG: hypothetical protein FJ395_11085 [Verrucomicrobia bacterium]|nr:hypothetical protein [Verrucomicrobiota bacterium]
MRTEASKPTITAPGAFSLLEVLLAMTILSLLVLAVGVTWSSGLRGWRRGGNVADSVQRQRIVTETIAELTRSLFYLSTDRETALRGTHDEAEGDTVSFITNSDLLLPLEMQAVGGMRRVTIGLQHDDQGRAYLGIQDSLALAPDESQAGTNQWRVLSADVSGFVVRYYDWRLGEWSDDWTPTRILASQLEYTITFGGQSEESPPVVVQRQVELPLMQSWKAVIPPSKTSTNKTSSKKTASKKTVSKKGRR